MDVKSESFHKKSEMTKILNFLLEYFILVIGGLLVWWIILFTDTNNLILTDDFVSIENIKRCYSEKRFFKLAAQVVLVIIFFPYVIIKYPTTWIIVLIVFLLSYFK